MDPLHRPFFGAVWAHDVERVRHFLTTNATFDVSTPDPTALNRTGLHVASSEGDLPMVKFFLSLPGIDPDKPDGTGWTPLYNACAYHRGEVVRELLMSGKNLDVNYKSKTGSSALLLAWRRNEKTIIQLLLLHAPSLEIPPEVFVADEKARPAGDLLKTFARDPKKARTEIIIELGLQGEMVARLFVLVVFVCDGYLEEATAARRPLGTLGEDVEAEEIVSKKRFLRMMVALPMDVQTIICNMVYESSAQFVLGKDSEPFFEEFIAEDRLKNPPPKPPQTHWGSRWSWRRLPLIRWWFGEQE